MQVQVSVWAQLQSLVFGQQSASHALHLRSLGGVVADGFVELNELLEDLILLCA